MKKAVLFLTLFVSFATCFAQSKKSTNLLLPPDVFEQKMATERGAVIDVRTPKEYQGGHIANAVNMHIYDKDFEQRIDKLDKSKPVYIYCKVGGRSAEAVGIMQRKGFRRIVELKGGMDAWIEAGKPVKK